MTNYLTISVSESYKSGTTPEGFHPRSTAVDVEGEPIGHQQLIALLPGLERNNQWR